MSNELVDALPVHLVDVSGPRLRESWVRLDPVAARPGGTVPAAGASRRAPAAGATAHEEWDDPSPDALEELQSGVRDRGTGPAAPPDARRPDRTAARGPRVPGAGRARARGGSRPDHRLRRLAPGHRIRGTRGSRPRAPGTGRPRTARPHPADLLPSPARLRPPQPGRPAGSHGRRGLPRPAPPRARPRVQHRLLLPPQRAARGQRCRRGPGEAPAVRRPLVGRRYRGLRPGCPPGRHGGSAGCSRPCCR